MGLSALTQFYQKCTTEVYESAFIRYEEFNTVYFFFPHQAVVAK